MKKHISFFVTLLMFIASTNIVFAQNIADEDPDWRTDSARIHQKIDSIFQNLNHAKQTSNYLFERVIANVSGFEFYDGKNDSIVDKNSWKQMYFELKHFAEFNPSGFPSYIDLERSIESINDNNVIPWGIININYNKIKPNAFDDRMLYIQNEQVYENFSTPSTPYEIKKAFIASPLNIDPLSSPATFLIDSSFYFSNNEDSILHFEIDFGDGNGYRMVNFGEQITINYAGVDSIFIITKAILNNDTLQSRSLAFVVNISNIQNKSVAGSGSVLTGCICDKLDGETYFNPDASWQIYVNGFLMGRAYIMYGAENTTGKVRKPFVFLDGIDFGSNCPPNQIDDGVHRYGDRGWEQFLMGESYNKNHQLVADWNIKKVRTLMKKLCSEEYDMVMLDFKDGAGDIPSNAMALARLIQMVNGDLVSNGSKNQIVVVGASMGGQVSRYALRFMELNPGTFGSHNTRLFISLDSPNRGANIPLGTQYAIRHATVYVATQKLSQQLFRPAAKQMLMYHYKPSKVSTSEALPYQEQIDFYNDPNMATFPANPRLVAITNGSGFGTDQGYSPGAKTIDIFTGRWFRAWAVENQKSNPETVFFGQSTSLVALGPLGLLLTVVFTDLVRMKNTLPFDNTSGGYRNTNEDFAQGLALSMLSSSLLHATQPKHSFIPTYSAMGIPLSQINNNITQPMNTVLGVSSYPAYPNNKTLTPFDAIYAPNANYEHIMVNDENIGWIMNEVSPENLYLQNKTLSSNAPLNGWAYEARETITIGKSVTGTIPQGDFVINSGAVADVRAGEQITIKDGTWFKPGSNVHLYINPFPCAAVHRMANPGGDNDVGENYIASINQTDFSKEEIKKNEAPLSNGEGKGMRLSAAYPNPFTDHTHIDYTISDSNAVNISVYDISGTKVATLVNANSHTAGTYTATLDARKLSPGIYFCTLTITPLSNGEGAGVRSETKKLILLR